MKAYTQSLDCGNRNKKKKVEQYAMYHDSIGPYIYNIPPGTQKNRHCGTNYVRITYEKANWWVDKSNESIYTVT